MNYFFIFFIATLPLLSFKCDNEFLLNINIFLKKFFSIYVANIEFMNNSDSRFTMNLYILKDVQHDVMLFKKYLPVYLSIRL